LLNVILLDHPNGKNAIGSALPLASPDKSKHATKFKIDQTENSTRGMLQSELYLEKFWCKNND